MQVCPVLLSYPRSGNSWLRFCIEAISQQPSYPDSDYIQHLRQYIKITNQRYVLRKEHSLYDDSDGILYNDVDGYLPIAKDKKIYRKEKLILLLRNYKECLVRQVADISDLVPEERDYINSNHRFNYVENIIEYDAWPESIRLLIYYEDLIIHPQKTLKKCVDFLGLNDTSLNNFMQQYEFYWNKSIIAYDNYYGSATKGKHMISHSCTWSKEKSILWDNKIKANHNDLFEKYLKRYETCE